MKFEHELVTTQFIQHNITIYALPKSYHSINSITLKKFKILKTKCLKNLALFLKGSSCVCTHPKIKLRRELSITISIPSFSVQIHWNLVSYMHTLYIQADTTERNGLG